jgi:hyaluronan synthase
VTRAAGWLIAVTSAAVIIGFHASQWAAGINFAVIFFVALAATLVWMLVQAARHPSWTHLPPAEGKVVCLVPAYNEKPELLAACVESLLAQTRPLDAIVVIDDGSVVPVVRSTDDPRVEWLWHDHNLGKRAAQISGLADQWDADYVVTADSDSIVAPDAVEHMLRAMSDPRVQGACAMVLVRNRARNLLTRVVDLEISLGNLVMRRARSSVGAVAPTSGTLAIYRAGVIRDNVPDYVEGTYSDDRRLTHYALQRGRVVALDEATVDTEMPETIPDTFRQRTRWFKGYMRYLPWELRNFTGWPLALRCWSLTLVALYPLIVAIVFVAWPLTGGVLYWQALVYWAVLLYAQTFHYVVSRPGLPLRTRLGVWLFLTPLLVVFLAAVIRPAMYWSLVKLRDSGWSTRSRRGRHRVTKVPPRHRAVAAPA